MWLGGGPWPISRPFLLSTFCFLLSLGVGFAALDVRCWMFDVGCWMLDVGCWMLDVGCWMLDVGCWLSSFIIHPSPFPLPPAYGLGDGAKPPENRQNLPVDPSTSSGRMGPE
jgi:hypothetical protein